MKTQYARNHAGFGEYLKDLQEARESNPSAKAIIAKLRQGAGDPLQNPNLFAHLHKVIPEGQSKRHEDSYLQVACLFSLHLLHETAVKEATPHKTHRNFGTSLKQLKSKLGTGANSLDLRFNALLNADQEDLYQMIRPLVQRLRSEGVTIDFAQLLRDFLDWEHTEQRVQRSWAKQYYRSSDEEPEAES